ncbi:hypothetical protein GBA52_020969 [Prunus armeniaca]|nr:hypothetical protein GBA52_020969 [Prunus armeniaca]
MIVEPYHDVSIHFKAQVNEELGNNAADFRLSNIQINSRPANHVHEKVELGPKVWTKSKSTKSVERNAWNNISNLNMNVTSRDDNNSRKSISVLKDTIGASKGKGKIILSGRTVGATNSVPTQINNWVNGQDLQYQKGCTSLAINPFIFLNLIVPRMITMSPREKTRYNYSSTKEKLLPLTLAVLVGLASILFVVGINLSQTLLPLTLIVLVTLASVLFVTGINPSQNVLPLTLVVLVALASVLFVIGINPASYVKPEFDNVVSRDSQCKPHDCPCCPFFVTVSLFLNIAITLVWWLLLLMCRTFPYNGILVGNSILCLGNLLDNITSKNSNIFFEADVQDLQFSSPTIVVFEDKGTTMLGPN